MQTYFFLNFLMAPGVIKGTSRESLYKKLARESLSDKRSSAVMFAILFMSL